MAPHEAEKLFEICGRIIELRKYMPRINPIIIATEALATIDPNRVSLPIVTIGCHLHLRQIARQLLRKQYEPKEENSNQSSLFPELQDRYPTAHSKDFEEPEYILRDLMSDADISYNLKRLRSEAETKLRHADALEAFGRSRRSAS